MTEDGAKRVLYLPLKAEFFDAIKAGTKTEEFRLVNPYWTKRLDGRTYDEIVLTKGYPSKRAHERRLRRPWRGYVLRTINHRFFGPGLHLVYAIQVNP